MASESEKRIRAEMAAKLAAEGRLVTPLNKPRQTHLASESELATRLAAEARPANKLLNPHQALESEKRIQAEVVARMAAAGQQQVARRQQEALPYSVPRLQQVEQHRDEAALPPTSEPQQLQQPLHNGTPFSSLVPRPQQLEQNRNQNTPSPVSRPYHVPSVQPIRKRVRPSPGPKKYRGFVPKPGPG